MIKRLCLIGLLFAGEVYSVIKFSNKQSGISFSKENSKLILETSLENVEGTILFKDNAPSRVVTSANSTITFSDGMTGIPGGEYSFTGTYNLAGSDSLILKDGDALMCNGSRIYPQVTVLDNASVKISGSLTFDQNPILSPGAILTLSLENELEKSFLAQGSNKIIFDRSLKLASRTDLNIGLLTTVDLNGHDIIFNGNISQVGQFIGSGTILMQYMTYPLNYDLVANGQVNITGNGSTLAVAYGNKVKFGSGFHSMSDLVIKDLGQTSSLEVNQAGTVFLSGVTLELFDDLTLSGQGTYVFTSGNCTIIPNGHKIYLDNGSRVIVDNCTLYYVQSNPLEVNPIEVINSGSGPGILSLDGPSANIFSTTRGLAVLDNTLVTGSSFSLDKNFDLTQLSTLRFANSAPLVAKSIAFSGNSYSVNFPPRSSTKLMTIDPNVTLTLSNVYLKGFSTNLINLLPNGNLVFADGNNLSFATDEVITSTFALKLLGGNSTIDGYGHSLSFNSSQALEVGTSTTTTIKNARVAINNPDAFLLANKTSTLIFQDCNIWIGKNGWNIPSGNLKFIGKTEIFGADHTAILSLVPIIFSSSGTLTIDTLSTLVVNKNIRLIYQPDPVDDLGLTKLSKRHWKMANPSATLELNGCTLVSTATALAFDYGKLFVRDLVRFEIDSGIGHEAELGTALELEVLAGATFDVQGPLRQVVSAFP